MPIPPCRATQTAFFLKNIFLENMENLISGDIIHAFNKLEH